MIAYYKRNIGLVILCSSLVLSTLSQAQSQGFAQDNPSTLVDAQESDFNRVPEVPLTPTNNNQESENNQGNPSDLNPQGPDIAQTGIQEGNQKLEEISPTVENNPPNNAPSTSLMDPTTDDRSQTPPGFQPDETLPFPPEDETESVPDEPEPEDGEFLPTEGNTPGATYNGQANFVNPPATIQFFTPSLGQTIQIPGMVNLSWNPIGLIIPPQLLNIEARNLIDNSVIPVANNLPSNTRIYSWNIPQGVSEGMYRLFVYTEVGKSAPVFPGHLSTYEGEVFELLYSIPPKQEKTLDFMSASERPASLSFVLFFATTLSAWIWVY
ncbi:hypothetical protein K7432_014875 [Basidiobolus ranarum]|uniref:DUF7137 domain-containing protein n=1 Tax=Basidiobolus ranarum TaxID=34480 RepID=A0ABR2VNU9_9FUNG